MNKTKEQTAQKLAETIFRQYEKTKVCKELRYEHYFIMLHFTKAATLSLITMLEALEKTKNTTDILNAFVCGYHYGKTSKAVMPEPLYELGLSEAVNENSLYKHSEYRELLSRLKESQNKLIQSESGQNETAVDKLLENLSYNNYELMRFAYTTGFFASKEKLKNPDSKASSSKDTGI